MDMKEYEAWWFIKTLVGIPPALQVQIWSCMLVALAVATALPFLSKTSPFFIFWDN